MLSCGARGPALCASRSQDGKDCSSISELADMFDCIYTPSVFGAGVEAGRGAGNEPGGVASAPSNEPERIQSGIASSFGIFTEGKGADEDAGAGRRSARNVSNQAGKAG